MSDGLTNFTPEPVISEVATASKIELPKAIIIDDDKVRLRQHASEMEKQGFEVVTCYNRSTEDIDSRSTHGFDLEFNNLIELQAAIMKEKPNLVLLYPICDHLMDEGITQDCVLRMLNNQNRHSDQKISVIVPEKISNNPVPYPHLDVTELKSDASDMGKILNRMQAKSAQR